MPVFRSSPARPVWPRAAALCALLMAAPATAQTEPPAPADSADAPPLVLNREEVAAAIVRFHPDSLRAAGVGGRVVLTLKVDEGGQGGGASIQASSGNTALDAAALRVAETIRFAPARLAGRKIVARVDLPVTFPSSGADASPGGAAVTGAAIGDHETGTVEVRPELRNRVQIARMIEREYPPAARALGIHAQVMVRMRVMEDGRPDPVEVLRSSGSAQFDAAALRVAAEMRFRPGRVHGEPVKVWVQIPIDFHPPSRPTPNLPE